MRRGRDEMRERDRHVRERDKDEKKENETRKSVTDFFFGSNVF